MIVIALVLFLLVWVQYVKNPVHQLSVFNNNFEQLFACMDNPLNRFIKFTDSRKRIKVLKEDFSRTEKFFKLKENTIKNCNH